MSWDTQVSKETLFKLTKLKRRTRNSTSSSRPIPPRCNPITTEKPVRHCATNITWMLCRWRTFNGGSRRKKASILKRRILRLLMMTCRNHYRLPTWNPVKEMSRTNKLLISWEGMVWPMAICRIRLTSINKKLQRTQTTEMVLKWNDFFNADT